MGKSNDPTRRHKMTFTALKGQNAARLYESQRKGGKALAKKRRQGQGEDDWWLYCSYEEFVAYLERIGK